jgi:hypothetical protein
VVPENENQPPFYLRIACRWNNYLQQSEKGNVLQYERRSGSLAQGENEGQFLFF